MLNQIRQYRHQLELKQTIRETQISLQTELNTSIEQAQHTIDYLNSYVSIYEVGFAILGIMVALLTLITPFATYHLAVKPSQKAVEALEKDFDNKVIELLLRRKDEQINDALNKIESVDPHVSQDALSYLTHIHNDGLNEIQLFKIYKITKHTSSASVKNQLSYILSTKKCDFSTDYFSSSTWKEDLGMLQLSAQYFARFGYYNYYGPIIKLIEEHKVQAIIQLIVSLNIHSPNDLGKLSNDMKIIGLLQNQDVQVLKNYKTFLEGVPDFDKTELGQKMK